MNPPERRPLSRAVASGIKAWPGGLRTLSKVSKLSVSLLAFLVTGDRAATPRAARKILRALRHLTKKLQNQAEVLKRAADRIESELRTPTD